jgi:hypothetical protein
MDPISAIGLAAGAGQFIQYCVKAVDGARILYSKSKRAGDSLLAIKREYTTITAAAENIKIWAHSATAAEESRKAQCASLEQAMKGLIPAVQRLVHDVEDVLDGTRGNGRMSVRGKLRYLWEEDKITAHLNEARWLSQHVHLLVSTMSM